MLLQSLIAEFEQEAKNTRKLLQTVPEKDLDFKPAPISWTMGELAQHKVSGRYGPTYKSKNASR